MSDSKAIKIPGPDHPITITPAKGRVTVTVTANAWPPPRRP